MAQTTFLPIHYLPINFFILKRDCEFVFMETRLYKQYQFKDLGIVKLLILYIYIYIKSKLGHVNIFSNFRHNFFDNQLLQQVGEEI